MLIVIEKFWMKSPLPLISGADLAGNRMTHRQPPAAEAATPPWQPASMNARAV
jgi:hypothetical protein